MFDSTIHGVPDNLAWVYVLEKGLTLNPTQIGLFKKTTQEYLPQEICTYLASKEIKRWHQEYAKNYRDALAHRIPLYVPPSTWSPEHEQKYRELHNQIEQAIKTPNPFSSPRSFVIKNMHLKIAAVFDVLHDHLRSRSDQLACFGKYEFQAEAWLKAEWIRVLDEMKTQGSIRALDREVKVNNKKLIDLAVDLDDGRHWIELKHWFLGRQKGQVWRPRDFMPELESEFEKFKTVKAGDRVWIATLCTTNPGTDAWASALNEFNREKSPWEVEPIDSPADYPPSYFLGVLHARGLDT